MFDPYAPTPDPDAPPSTPQLGALMSGQQTPAAQPTPPVTPEQHANLKQSWMDWFHNPTTAAFLLQAGASMLSNAGQPGMSLGRVVGQGIGEGGEAVARQSQQELEQEKQATEAQKAGTEKEKATALTGYYKQEGAARLKEADAQWQNALTKVDMLPIMEQKLALQGAANDALAAYRGSQIDLSTQKLHEQQITDDYNNKLKDIEAKQKAAQTEVILSPQKRYALDNYYKAVASASQLGMDPPDPKLYNLTPEDLGAPAAAAAPPPPTTAAPTTTAPPHVTGTGRGPPPKAPAQPAAAPAAPITPVGTVKSFSLPDGKVVTMRKSKAGVDTDKDTWESVGSGQP